MVDIVIDNNREIKRAVTNGDKKSYFDLKFCFWPNNWHPSITGAS